MNLSDTFYIALCMTVLILGVVYWFWTQNQYIQRKINLLENIVYEMKTAFQSPGSLSAQDGLYGQSEQSDQSEDGATGATSATGATGATGAPVAPVEYPPAPSSVIDEDDEDLLHEELHAEATFPPSVPHVEGERLQFLPSDQNESVEAELVADDLQPGGVGSGMPPAAQTETKGFARDGMTLKELKRLAEQRGISGTSAMRKQQLVDALRALPAAPSLASIMPLEGVVDLS